MYYLDILNNIKNKIALIKNCLLVLFNVLKIKFEQNFMKTYCIL